MSLDLDSVLDPVAGSVDPVLEPVMDPVLDSVLGAMEPLLQPLLGPLSSDPVLWSVLWSLLVLGTVVFFCELLRGLAARLVARDCGRCLLEGASTLQLCWCALELRLLGDGADLSVTSRLTLLYLITLVHLGTFRGASCSFVAPLERVWRRQLGVKAAAGIVLSQLTAALASQTLAVLVWSQGWSQVHRDHRRLGYRCSDPLGGTLLEAAATELTCSFIIQGVVLHLHRLQPALRPHALSAAITAVVFAGGAVSGAVLNPVLAVALQFSCSGHSYLDYLFVYWLGPVLGVASCHLFFEVIVPSLSGRSSEDRDVAKKKTQ